jgi:two-component sensor histidine kinase
MQASKNATSRFRSEHVSPDGPRFLQNPKGAQLPFRDAASRGLVEMNHRIANSLQLTVGYLRMQANELGGESGARQALNTAAARVSLTADLHRQISTHPDSLGVDLAAYLTILCRNLTRSIGVEVAFAGEAVGVSFGTAHRIAQIVVELAINAGKHAGAGRRGSGRLRVDCRRDNAGALRLTLSDDGRGLPATLVRRAGGGLGLAIVAALVEDLDGHLDIKRGHGTTFELTVPFHH